MKAVNQGYYNADRSDDFINAVINTVTTNGHKVDKHNFRGSIDTVQYSFGQWILSVETTAYRDQATDNTAFATLTNMATWELYRFRVEMVRNNPSPLGWSTYSVRRPA